MNEFVELCYSMLFTPRRAFAAMKDHLPLQSALLIVVLVNALQVLLNGATGATRQLVEGVQVGNGYSSMLAKSVELLNSPGFIVFLTMVSVVIALFWLFVKSAIFQLVAELLGGTGTAREVMSVLGAAQFPMILVIPIYILVYLLELSPAWSSGAGAIAWIYTALILPVWGIAHVHNFSTSRAVATVLSPMLAVVAGLTLLSMIFVSFIGLVTPFIN